MKSLRFSGLLLLASVLLLVPTLVPAATPDCEASPPGWMQALLLRFLGTPPVAGASLVGPGDVVAEDPAGPEAPGEDAPATPLPEGSSHDESGHLIDPDG